MESDLISESASTMYKHVLLYNYERFDSSFGALAAYVGLSKKKVNFSQVSFVPYRNVNKLDFNDILTDETVVYILDASEINTTVIYGLCSEALKVVLIGSYNLLIGDAPKNLEYMNDKSRSLAVMSWDYFLGEGNKLRFPDIWLVFQHVHEKDFIEELGKLVLELNPCKNNKIWDQLASVRMPKVLSSSLYPHKDLWDRFQCALSS